MKLTKLFFVAITFVGALSFTSCGSSAPAAPDAPVYVEPATK